MESGLRPKKPKANLTPFLPFLTPFLDAVIVHANRSNNDQYVVVEGEAINYPTRTPTTQQ